MAITGGKIIYNRLLKNNVKDVFLYSGGAIMPLVDTFYKSKINYYVNSNEHNGCFSAVGYAKSTNKTGVMITTSGPGLTNCITPMLDSTNDSTPLVVISGQVPLSVMGTQAFQECPATEITKPVTKWSYCVQSIDELSDVVDEAFYIANNGKKGTVHIDLPKCIAASTTTSYNDLSMNKTFNNLNKLSEDKFNSYIKEISEVINKSKNPVFYIGQGCNNASKELRDLIYKSNIPVTTTLHAMGVFDESHSLSLKMCGMHGSYYANKAIQNADCIIAIGARFDDRTTGNPKLYAPFANKNKAIIHCNIEQSEINKNIESHYSVNCDSKLFIDELNKYIEPKTRQHWLTQINNWKNEHPFEYNECLTGEIKTQSVLSELNKQTLNLQDIIYTFGVGNHLMMGCQFIDWKRPKQVIASGSLGAMGCSIGYAIGAQIANPDKRIISIDGDGSFNMSLTDLKTIKEYNIPVKIAIMNDSSLSMVRIWEKLFFEERYTATNNPQNPDYVSLGNSFGIKSLYCDNQNNLSQIVDEFLNYDGPIICEFKVIGEECLPLVSPGKALDNMILFREYNKQQLNLKGELAPN